jgi:sulfur carrier protein
MEIEINGVLKTINNPISLLSLVDEIVNDTKGLAVAVNNSVVPKEKWTEKMLNEADKVLLIRATQGG